MPAVRPTTLVVEGDEAVAVLLCTLLEEHGQRCVTARNADEALRVLAGPGSGAAIVELRLPGKDGWWLVRHIRAHPAHRQLPVVVIAGFLDDAVRFRADELGCACLGKPFAFSALAEQLTRAAELATGLAGHPGPEAGDEYGGREPAGR
jgi:CheY-like chemotaxis protein